MGKEKGTKANPFVKKTLSSTLKGRQQMFHAKQEPLFAGGPAGTTKHVPVATPRVHGVHPSQEHLFSTGERLRVSAGNIASGIPGKVSMAGHIFTEAMGDVGRKVSELGKKLTFSRRTHIDTTEGIDTTKQKVPRGSEDLGRPGVRKGARAAADQMLRDAAKREREAREPGLLGRARLSEAGSRGYSIPRGPARPIGPKGAESAFRKKERVSAGWKGFDWLLSKEKTAEGKSTYLKGRTTLGTAALATGLASMRLEHLKRSDPERYKKERKLYFAAATGAGLYLGAKTTARMISKMRAIKKALP